ncbi:MAG: pyridoxal phosphate-dependent aminotransferase [Gleimia sp.]|jgi:aspartate/methionine/tyrosine aminotransferase|nr:aminotransferase class I/II-fold pyridoxal phosphate-dependent enzyme [Acidobacteriota bacterium]
MEILKQGNELAQSGREIYSLCLGQPSTPAPTPVLEAAHQALEDEQLGYTDSNGIRALRERIAKHYQDEYDTSVNPDNIVITTGSSAAFTAIFLAAFEAGERVAMTRPGYAAYRNTLKALGYEVVDIDTGPDTRWQPSVEQLEELKKQGKSPAGLLLASPSNPTGTILEPEMLKAIAKWCDENECLLISDEIYHGISFGPECTSVVQFSDQNIAVGSFSKYYSMTGWRLGWAVVPTELVRPVELLLGNLNLSAPTLSQFAAIAAFDTESVAELDEHVQRYAENRRIVLEGLRLISTPLLAPADGAFYCYADVSHLCEDSAQWAAELLEATGVAVTPGIDFAPNSKPGDGLDPVLDGKKFVRISFAGSTEEVTTGMDLLVDFVRS